MPKYNLKCNDCEYVVEAWFSRSEDYEYQKEKDLVLCVSCNSHNVVRDISSPNVTSKSNQKPTHREKVKKLYEWLDNNSRNVGDALADESIKNKKNGNPEILIGTTDQKGLERMIDHDINSIPLPDRPVENS